MSIIEPPIAARDVANWDITADIIVAGLGVAGVSAALEAFRAGADVLVLERASGGGGASATSEGIFYLGGGTKLQKDLGYDETVDNVYAFMRASTTTPDEDKLRLFCESSPAHFDWLEAQGVPFERRTVDLADRPDWFRALSPLGKVFHAGTLAGNPLATAAGLAALNELTDDVYMELAARARRVASMLRDASAAAGVDAQFPVVGTLVGMFFGSGNGGRAPVNFDEAKKTDEALYARIFHALLNEGVALAPGAYEALFVGCGHDDVVLDDLTNRVHTALLKIGS